MINTIIYLIIWFGCGLLWGWIFWYKKKDNIILEPCANERPKRKTLCQLPKGHKGSHSAVIFWEDIK